jgi:hypothetical protein
MSFRAPGRLPVPIRGGGGRGLRTSVNSDLEVGCGNIKYIMPNCKVASIS